MLHLRFTGPWEKVRKELDEHEAELGGHEVTLDVSETDENSGKKQEARTLADALKGRVGRFSFDAPSATEVKKVFGEILEEKYREGHL